MEPHLLTFDNIHGVFCDAYVANDDNIIFVSLWGRDTAIQELLAKLTIQPHQGGLNYLSLVQQDQTRSVLRVGNPDQLGKLTARMPKANLFGDVVHLWLFDIRTQEPDKVNKNAFLLLNVWPATTEYQAVWALFKSLCHLPMLDTWQDTIISLLKSENWLREHKGFRINAIEIRIPETEFNEKITTLIQRGELLI